MCILPGVCTVITNFLKILVNSVPTPDNPFPIITLYFINFIHTFISYFTLHSRDQDYLEVYRLLVVVFVVLLPLEPLRGIPFAVAWSNIWHKSSLLGHRDHGTDAFLLPLAKSRDTARQHTTIRSHVLSQDQHIGVFNLKP